jgi:TolB-like protein/Tfp pilus assembly protein PilF
VRFIFSDHMLDTERRELRRGADLVAVEPQVFDLLVHLLANCDRVVSKDDLIASIWRSRIVSDSTVTTRINAARKAIGDSGDVQKLIRTIPRKGFRFVGEVCTLADNGKLAALSLERTHDWKLALPLPDRPAVAVLAFKNMTGDPQHEHFSDGISEDIITALSKLRWFFVIAHNTSFTYKGKTVPLKQIGEELGVGYVIEGSVRKDGDRVRITAQLNDVFTGRQIWAERYDRKLTEVFAVQDEITDAIVAAIEPQLYAVENFRAQRKPPDSIHARDLVMRALSHYWRITRQDNLVAQALLEKALSLDPNCSQAHGVLAASHSFGAHMGWEDSATAAPIAESAAQAAILGDSGDPWAHYALGCVYMFARRFDDSRAEFEWALRLNPNFSLAQAYYSHLLICCGSIKESELAAERALKLSPYDPLSAIYLCFGAIPKVLKGNYQQAMLLLRESIRRRPDFACSHRVFTAAAGMVGEGRVANAALQELRRVQPNVSLEWVTKQVPFRLEAHRQYYLEGLRRAGLD